MSKVSKKILGNSNKKYRRIGKYLFYAGISVGLASVLAETALATAAFDINKGVEAATSPFIAGMKAHWGKGVLLTGTGAALMGEGDARQRAYRAGIGCAAASAVIMGLLALLTSA